MSRTLDVNKQLESFSTLFPGYCVHGISGLDSTQILRGMPKGGVLIIFPDSMGGKIEYLTTNSKRLCAIKIDIDGLLLYTFCVYMPCDVNDVMNISEYDDVLNTISMMCTKHNAEYICIAGDMNTDFSSHYYSLLEMNNYIYLCIMKNVLLIIPTLIHVLTVSVQ